MSTIKPIRATSAEGGEVYRLLVMVHRMAGALANSNNDSWRLAETCSMEGFPLVTTWTNGVVNIRAESIEGEHEYSLEPCVEPEII